MESKILNFPDAMRLASILSKYIDVDSLAGKTGEEVLSVLSSTMTVEDIVASEGLLLVGSNETDPVLILSNCINSMIKNNILDLLIQYKQIGMGK